MNSKKKIVFFRIGEYGRMEDRHQKEEMNKKKKKRGKTYSTTCSCKFHTGNTVAEGSAPTALHCGNHSGMMGR